MLLLAATLSVLPPGAAPAVRSAPLVPAVPADSVLDAARRAMAAGQPWQASRVLAVALADSNARTPARVLLAASAAAAWGGAGETIRWLRTAPWLDREADGEGHALLAAAYLAQRRDSLALGAARAAVRSAVMPRVRAEREVLLARALDRLDQRDSSAVHYRSAALALPTIADWLVLRGLGVTDDSVSRAALARAVKGSTARARVPWMQAQALERRGDSAAAARAYAAVGATLTALALRAETSAADSVRGALVAMLARGIGGEDGRTAVALLRQSGRVSAAEQRLMAGTLDRGGDAAGAALAYAAAHRSGVLTPAERLAYADLLVRLARHADAIALYTPLVAHPTLGGTAAYRRARAHARAGDGAVARRLLLQIPMRWPRDVPAASQALYLLGDLATDDLDDAAAVAYWQQLTGAYPSAALASAARFRTGIALYALGRLPEATRVFDSLPIVAPRSADALAARYWAGRMHAEQGDTATAHARWRAVIAADQRSWYASLAEARLGVEPWRPSPMADRFDAAPDADSTLAATRLLQRLGLDPEARRELAALVRAADTARPVERLLAVANALRSAGFGAEAITVARRAAAKQTDADARTWRLLYPLAYAEALHAEAAARGVDPSFAAALIRQESLYEATATSRAGARGLMQLMPEVGRLTARGLRYPQWDVALLWQPDVNLELGMAHLAELLARYREPVRVLAAYNAGASRVERWATKGGVQDPELFAERIPYAETRDYVRVIQRNQQFYRALYEWPPRALQP